MNWAWEQELPPGSKLILMALADHADDTGKCWPRVKVIASKCCVSTRTVQRTLNELRVDGLVSVKQDNDATGRQTANRYQLAMAPYPDKLSPPTKRAPARGDTADTPGATQLCHGVSDTAVSPLEPPQEPSKKPPPHEAGAAPESPLCFPVALSDADRHAISVMLQRLPQTRAQPLLDELAGTLERPGSIRTTPVRWFRKLLQLDAGGQFSPSAGIHIAARRNANKVPAQSPPRPATSPTPPSADVRKRLQATKARVLANANRGSSGARTSDA